MEESSIPKIDSQQVALDEFERNKEDNRTYLSDAFTNAGAVLSNQTAEAKKLFPGDGKKESGTSLMKVAKAVFLDTIKDSGISPLYSEVSFKSFCDEIEKIAFPKK